MRSRSIVIAIFLLLGASRIEAQTRIVTGRVVDSLTQEVISSGQVSVQGTQIGSTIRDDGTFTIATPLRDLILVVRSIGYKRKDLSVPASQGSVQVALERDYFQLEAIVVTGQATGVERKNLANAVSSVNAEQLAKSPTASVEQSLQGKLAGAQITNNTFAPGGGVMVRLRGVTSINGTFTPLYVVDGVIVSDAAVAPGNNFITQSAPGTALTGNTDGPVNRIADINPSDIENIEVLKGASASAIYGSKASNGVIIITTKRGRAGAPQFHLVQRLGASRMSNQIGSRRFTSAAEALATFGPGADVEYNLTNGAFFDHEKELAGGTPLSTETSLDVSGGTETSRYFASALAKHDGAIVAGTFYDKQTMRLNLDQEVGRRISFSISGAATHSISDRGLVNNENNGSSYWSAFSTTPSFFDLRAVCPDGSRQVACEGGVYPVNRYGSSNPLQTAAGFENREHLWRFLGMARFNLDLITTPRHTFRFLANGGADFFNQKNEIFSPPDLQFEGIDGLLGTSTASINDNLNSNLNGNLVYTFKSGGTSATTQVGLSYETRSLDMNRTLGANLVGGLAIPQAGTTIFVESRKEKTRDLGGFVQEEFLTLGERLLLTAGLRADQSSANGDPNKLFYYPKASASYRLGVKKGLVDEIKLRAAVGQSGNQPKYGTKFTELDAVNIGGVAASQLLTVTASDSLKPERQREVEGGFDATLLGGRASLEATIYEKKISDLVLRRGLATSTGFIRQVFNGGSLRNRGLELSLNTLPIQSRSVQWNARINYAMNRCIITALAVPTFRSGGVTFGAIQTEVGKSCTQIMANDTLGRLPGDAALGAIGSAIVRPIRNQEPDFNLGLSNDITVKALRFYFLWDWQKGGALANLTTLLYDFPGNSPDQKVARSPGANGPAGLTGDERAANYAREGLIVVEDQSYIKLREVSLTFEVPTAAVHRLWGGARFVRLSVTGRNLLTFAPYLGMDPEATQQPASLAQTRVLDIWPYPPSRSIWFSVDLGF